MTPASKTGGARSTGALRIGSLGVHIDAPRPIYLEDLAAIFSTELHRCDDVPATGLHLEIAELSGPPNVKVPPDGIVITPESALYTEAMFAQTALDGSRPHARLNVFVPDLSDDERRIYLVVLLNKILVWMGYTRLHASAISLDGKANVFIGDRGAGKSTICAYLAGRGGLVLADDDVILHHDGNAYAVSGCDETMRIMDDAETHLFGRLDVPARDFSGFAKKEIVTAERFAGEPYIDHNLDRMFFPRVGGDFSVKRLSSGQLVMRLMSALAGGARWRPVPASRFAAAQDHARTLSYIADVADRVSAYELTLSRDFVGLDRLFEFLKSGSA